MITREDELRKLAITGLKMGNHIVQRHLTNKGNNITTAAHHVLEDWRTSQPNQRVAYVKLCKALKDVKMAFYINKALR